MAGRRHNWAAQIKSGEMIKRVMNDLFTYQAKRIGEKAHQLIALSELQGSLLAVFSSVAYLKVENGEIFWIANADRPLHQRSLVISYCSELFATGQNFCCQSSKLQVGEGRTILIDQASLWQAPALDQGTIPSLPELRHIFQSWPPAFHEIVYPWNQICIRFCSAVASFPEQKIDSIIEKSEKLIGLGPGLTPAGDDFVGGLLFVVHLLRKAYPDYLQVDEKMIINFLAWARPRTNLISWTILKDLASGQGPEPVYKIMNKLWQGKNFDPTWSEVDELTRIGQATGAAIFYGMLTGLRLILGGDSQKYRK